MRFNAPTPAVDAPEEPGDGGQDHATLPPMRGQAFEAVTGPGGTLNPPPPLPVGVRVRVVVL
ncbi:hypothetical protein Gobs01_04844 [Geodermatophilus obscurus DSM 43160]|uniref:Uncharacterized protein n=1 Tax=Geodermatophilus obscurus (strain ATCC 25078 / DSM 43160 / JCM 3152 / CCUG 61914 / KCC A-0152 / KCTC 9177 / NBRC 13315 / NRRL B-3577 / G-20) TaxID=526225 RepID=D2S5J4_GEOOG|nr:hypothetical protein Gobs_2639 [Geodermatophilus obscurus DSM 43160]